MQNLKVVLEAQENLPHALDFYRENLLLKQALGDRHGKATALITLGNLAYKVSRLDKALDYWRQAQQVLAAFNVPETKEVAR
ncbi:MAG: tetratricopeptide repeat protein [Nitrososphaera sp.]|nr:tetratricopeptide repeat protein [Nitrososphaera sp.]